MPLKNTEYDEEIQEVIASSLAAAEGIHSCAVVAAGSSELAISVVIKQTEELSRSSRKFSERMEQIHAAKCPLRKWKRALRFIGLIKRRQRKPTEKSLLPLLAVCLARTWATRGVHTWTPHLPRRSIKQDCFHCAHTHTRLLLISRWSKEHRVKPVLIGRTSHLLPCTSHHSKYKFPEAFLFVSLFVSSAAET